MSLAKAATCREALGTYLYWCSWSFDRIRWCSKASQWNWVFLALDFIKSQMRMRAHTGASNLKRQGNRTLPDGCKWITMNAFLLFFCSKNLYNHNLGVTLNLQSQKFCFACGRYSYLMEWARCPCSGWRSHRPHPPIEWSARQYEKSKNIWKSIRAVTIYKLCIQSALPLVIWWGSQWNRPMFF